MLDGQIPFWTILTWFQKTNSTVYKFPTSNLRCWLTKKIVDRTGQDARMTTFMKDVGTGKMECIQENVQNKIDQLLPKEGYYER